MRNNERKPEYQNLDYDDEQLIMKVQALVDNELSEEEIPAVMAEIEGNYRLRDEYIQLLQLKRQLAGMPKLALRREWYEGFEKQKRKKIPMLIGAVFAAIYAVWSLIFFSAEILDYSVPRWIHIAGLFALTASIISFTVNAVWQRSTERNSDRSYKDVIR